MIYNTLYLYSLEAGWWQTTALYEKTLEWLMLRSCEGYPGLPEVAFHLINIHLLPVPLFIYNYVNVL